MSNIESNIQYRFNNNKLLKQALTHRSICSENNYEKLEFLGDSIINFYVTNWLFSNYKNANESELSIRRAQLINKKKLAYISKELKLYKGLIIEKNIILSERIHCDIFESLIGAIYMDSNYNTVHDILNNLSYFFKNSNKNYDFKGKIISLYNQKKIKSLKIITEKYKKTNFFLTIITINDYHFYGFGKTKKHTEKKTSKLVYDFIESNITI